VQVLRGVATRNVHVWRLTKPKFGSITVAWRRLLFIRRASKHNTITLPFASTLGDATQLHFRVSRTGSFFTIGPRLLRRKEAGFLFTSVAPTGATIAPFADPPIFSYDLSPTMRPQGFSALLLWGAQMGWCSIAAAAEPEKTTTTPQPCTATSSTSDSFYDLRPDMAVVVEEGAKKKKGVRTTDYAARGYDYGSNFTINICAAVVKPVKDIEGVSDKLAANVSAYYQKGSKIYSLGYVGNGVVGPLVSSRANLAQNTVFCPRLSRPGAGSPVQGRLALPSSEREREARRTDTRWRRLQTP